MTRDASNLEPIFADAVYPVRLFCRLAGLSQDAYRAAVRRGLRVATVGKRRFVTGREWLRFIEEQGT